MKLRPGQLMAFLPWLPVYRGQPISESLWHTSSGKSMEIQVLNKTEGWVWGTMVVSSSNETLLSKIATYVFSRMCPGKWTGSRNRKSCEGSLRKGYLWASIRWEVSSWVLCDITKRWPACPDVLSLEELDVWEAWKRVTQASGQESRVNGQISGPSGVSLCRRVCSLVWGTIRCGVLSDSRPGCSEA